MKLFPKGSLKIVIKYPSIYRKLQTEYNAYFESCFAILLARHHALFPAVDKVSSLLIHLLEAQQTVIKIIFSQPDNFYKLQNSLYVEEFGALPNKKNTLDAMLQDIYRTLQDRKAPLVNVMAIHSIFACSIIPLLNITEYQAAKLQFKSTHNLVNFIKNYVKEKPGDPILTSQLGVTRFPLFCQKINKMPEIKEINQTIHTCQHIASLERFNIEEAAPLHAFIKNNVPLAAGLSAHTLALLIAIKVYEFNSLQIISAEELKEYSLAYFTYLALAGYHTFHEVMLVTATNLKTPYHLDNYAKNFPKQFLQNAFIQELCECFFNKKSSCS